jgi:tagaturonate reductase
MILSRYTIKNLDQATMAAPEESQFELPEKVLQFGTDVLLRGLPDYFIDKANRQGLFNGRIVVVKSTFQGDSISFEKQDGLYTQCIRGFQNGQPAEENIINASISRVLQANTEWKEVLDCAHNPHLQVIVSNTTEVGIELVNDDIRQHPPKSFPGKVLAFLYERFKAFAGSEQSGMVIVPTEMIPDNGDKLQAIGFELDHLNSLEDDFIEWLECCNRFCNSLVDRIVPGKPDAATQKSFDNSFSYTDQLLIVSEVHRLWAIEGDEDVKKVLSFAQADEGMIIEPDITVYRELKLRLPNGTHTFACGLSFLASSKTVKQSMNDEALSGYITDLMKEEIAHSIPYPIGQGTIQAFADNVLNRFRNPYLEHHWLSIALNYSSKMRTRCIPLLLRHYKLYQSVPELMALGFAGYLCFSRPVVRKEEGYYGEANGEQYLLHDDEAARFYRQWAGLSTPAFICEVLSDEAYWGTDLYNLPGFADAVLEKLNLLLEGELKEAMSASLKA